MKIIILLCSVLFYGCAINKECETCKGYIAPPPEMRECRAEEMQHLVGQNRNILHTMRFGVVTRIIEPNSVVTMDYSPSRLNIYIDKDNKIKKVTCG